VECEKTKVAGAGVALSRIDNGRESYLFVVDKAVVVALFPVIVERACAVMLYIRSTLRVFVNRPKEQIRQVQAEREERERERER